MQQLKLSTKLNRISERAKQNSEAVFDNLAHLITTEHLERSFYDLKSSSSAGVDGVDGVSYQDYEKNVKVNILDLYNRLRTNKYRAKPLKRVYIPKEDGKKRPLSIPSLEDKIVQRTVVRILNCIYENDFLPCSYGYRPKRNAHQAIKAVRNKIATDNISYVLDADVTDFFGTIDKKKLMLIVEKRVKDKTILRLIGKWLKTGYLEEGTLKTSASGTPQGSVISPLLANIYLHEVLDLWVDKTVKKHTTGVVELYRFADDFIMCFQSWETASKVYKALPKRFKKFGLTLHPKKTKLMRFGRFAKVTLIKKKQGKKPPTFNFLGFTFMCRTSRNNKFTVFVKTQKERFRRGIKKVREWCRRHRHLPMNYQAFKLNQILRGHYQYYGLTSNAYAITRFFRLLRRTWFFWLSRRSQKPLRWDKFAHILKKNPLLEPKIQEGKNGVQFNLLGS